MSQAESFPGADEDSLVDGQEDTEDQDVSTAPADPTDQPVNPDEPVNPA